MSTSHLVSEQFENWGFGNVVPDGLGIGYSVRKGQMNFNVVSEQGWADGFARELQGVLTDMHEICE